MNRTARVAAAIGMMFAVTLAAAVPQTAEAAPKTRAGVRLVIDPPTSAADEHTLRTLESIGAFDTMQQYISPLELPRALTIKLKGCNGDRNGYYGDDVITICYDYLDYMAKVAPQVPPALGISTKAAVIAPMIDLVLHEMGHAVFDMLHIPVLGREEDAADMFSAYLMLQFAPANAYDLIAGTTYLAATEAKKEMKRAPTLRAFANEHGIPARRYYNYWCLAYGSDPKTFADALTVGHLTKERASDCSDEWHQIKYAFDRLIKPHIDLNLLEKVEAEQQFRMALAPEAPAVKHSHAHH